MRSKPQLTVQQTPVRLAGFEPATYGLGNDRFVKALPTKTAFFPRNSQDRLLEQTSQSLLLNSLCQSFSDISDIADTARTLTSSGYIARKL